MSDANTLEAPKRAAIVNRMIEGMTGLGYEDPRSGFSRVLNRAFQRELNVARLFVHFRTGVGPICSRDY